MTSSAAEDKVCYVCGDAGFAQDLVTCFNCKISEHVYCMHELMYQVPAVWYCEECLPSAWERQLFAVVIIAAALISSSGRPSN